ncbi:MAG: RES domain-containing protein [Alphaproteobacteria bacterium]|nr:RES domain-containing protein [Alphaproteobacteria bacterium]
MSPIPIAQVEWRPCWRIIPSRFPPVALLRRIAPEEDWELLNELDGMTNDRLRDQGGAVNLVRPEDRISGQGSSLIMAPFTHPNPDGDSLTDGSFGVSHVTESFEAALRVSIHRREKFLRNASIPATTIQMRVLNMDLRANLHDLRGMAQLTDTESDFALDLGRRLRDEGSYGVLCNITTIAGAVIFRPPVLTNCRQERHLAFEWDSERIASVYDYSAGQRILPAKDRLKIVT